MAAPAGWANVAARAAVSVPASTLLVTFITMGWSLREAGDTDRVGLELPRGLGVPTPTV